MTERLSGVKLQVNCLNVNINAECDKAVAYIVRESRMSQRPSGRALLCLLLVRRVEYRNWIVK